LSFPILIGGIEECIDMPYLEGEDLSQKKMLLFSFLVSTIEKRKVPVPILVHVAPEATAVPAIPSKTADIKRLLALTTVGTPFSNFLFTLKIKNVNLRIIIIIATPK
jgi:hypothetical protein